MPVEVVVGAAPRRPPFLLPVDDEEVGTPSGPISGDPRVLLSSDLATVSIVLSVNVNTVGPVAVYVVLCKVNVVGLGT